jgi:hypothetical protein
MIQHGFGLLVIGAGNFKGCALAAGAAGLGGNCGLFPLGGPHHVIGPADYPLKGPGFALRAFNIDFLTGYFEKLFEYISAIQATKFVDRHN